MRWITGFITALLALNIAQASELTVDQAVKRLLKDLDSVQMEVIKVPVPGPATVPVKGGKAAQQTVPAGAIPTSGTYRVRRGETLDMVIRRLAPNSPLQKQVLQQAFVKANPHAFRRNNPNWLYAGAVLQVPDVEHLRQVIFKETPGRLKKDISDEKAGWVRFP
jgi:hypothetical protein